MQFVSAVSAIATALLAVGAVGAAAFKWVVLPNLKDYLEGIIKQYLSPIKENLGELNDYQHRRNHDILNLLTALLGWVKFFHREDIAKMDPEMAKRIEQILNERRWKTGGPPDGVERRQNT